MKQIPPAILEAVESVRLSSMPQVLLRFLRLVEDDHASMKQLAKLVGQDPALSARVLTIANSAALRQMTEIKNLEQCMIALGTRLARTIAACLAVQSVFANTSADQQYDLKGFWRHSLWVAEIARQLAVESSYPDVEEAYLAGLLHDVGQLMLLGGVGENYESVLGMSRDESLLQSNEQSMLGTDHAQVGAWLVDQWQLSSFMGDAVLFHHMPAADIAVADRLSRLVWSAHVVVEQGIEPETITPDLHVVAELLEIEHGRGAEIREATSKEVAILAEALGVSVTAEARTLPCLPTTTSFEKKRSKPNHEDPARAGLEAVVRDRAILQPLQQNLAGLVDEAEILLAVRESARILFGTARLAFLVPKEDKKTLCGAEIPGQPEILQRLEIGIAPGKSLAAAAALGEQPRSTFDEERPAAVSLVDVQIARALDSEGLLYIPMRAGSREVGVMAYGLSAAQYGRVKKQLAWMSSFGNSAALSLQSWRDIKDRERAIEEKIHAELEQKARKIAHEAGNPLGIIRNYLKIVKQRLPEESGVGEEMEVLREEVERVSQIIRKLGNKPEAALPAARLDVNAVIEGMLALYGESLFAECGINLEKALTPGLSPIAGDRDSVKQILLNLWKNASEALPEGSSLRVTTKDHVERQGRPFVEIEVSDTGPGLPGDVKQSLFKPLDPNRRQGHSGLGLSIVAELVERLGGEITCHSEVGAGTSFNILLPQAVRE
ncbi:HDOD domain-containing protein [Geomesophilobacter sediminis]|uniref:histidine kinase n=1 Tax=Geomesophilobacter sediminis TaxID=2798584 RepID=A0A8J7INT4_9BACT|nr:HDOD domain-containing protein [Geomesophilobacter sediminis]MBJ6723814.1 HDOD domain-containing protein [Geomesophilobacter sediminis]